MTNEERDALVELARQKPWTNEAKRPETEALIALLIAGLDETRGELAKVCAAASCGFSDESDEKAAPTCPACGVYHADGPRACVSIDPRVAARALLEHREAAMVRVMDGAREERDRAERERDKAREETTVARAQLAALHAAAARFVHSLGDDEEDHPTLGRVRVSRADDGAEENLDRVLADLATAAAEHERCVRADERVKALQDAEGVLDIAAALADRDRAPAEAATMRAAARHLRAMADEAEGTR